MAVIAGLILSWILVDHLTRAVWHPGWALMAAILLISGTQALTLAGISFLTRNSERRLARQIRKDAMT